MANHGRLEVLPTSADADDVNEEARCFRVHFTRDADVPGWSWDTDHGRGGLDGLSSKSENAAPRSPLTASTKRSGPDGAGAA